MVMIPRLYISSLNNIRTELKKMFDPIEKYRTKTNIGRTVGTTVGFAGTALAVTGALLAPVTFGTSLGLTIGGAAVGIVAGTSTASIAYNDYRATKVIVSKIDLILEKLDSSSKELDKMLKDFELTVVEMKKLGYTELNAITRTFLGVVHGVVDVGRIGQNAGSVALAVANMQIENVTFGTASTFVKASGLASGGQAFTSIATKKAVSFSMPGAGAASTGGNIAQSSSSLIIGLSVAFGVGFTVLDILLLLNSWRSKHPTAYAIEILINKIKDEINKWQNFSVNIYKYLTDNRIYELIRIIQNNEQKHRQRDIEIKQHLENVKKQMKEEAEERDRRMKDNYEERERQMKQELKQEFQENVHTLEAKFEAKFEAFISIFDNK